MVTGRAWHKAFITLPIGNYYISFEATYREHTVYSHSVDPYVLYSAGIADVTLNSGTCIKDGKFLLTL